MANVKESHTSYAKEQEEKDCEYDYKCVDNKDMKAKYDSDGDSKDSFGQTFTGTVVWFDAKKGLGFIKRDDGKPDIFVFYTDIKMSGYKLIMENDRVSFEEDYSYKNKLKAGNVKIIGIAEDTIIDDNIGNEKVYYRNKSFPLSHSRKNKIK